MSGARVTTVLPTYRRPIKLKRAISSVLAQTYQDFQLIVYDNASGDETEQVVREYAAHDPRVRYHCHEVNIGAIENFRYAMQQVETPLFTLLSDDDLVLPGFLERAVALMDSDADLGFVVTPVIHADDQERVLEPFGRFWFQAARFEPPNGLLAMLDHGAPAWTSIVFRREVLDTLGGLHPGLGGPADLDFELRLAAHYPFAVEPTPGGVLFLDDGVASGGGQFGLLWPHWLTVINNLAEDNELDLEVRALATQRLTVLLTTLLFKCGIGASRRGRWTDARQAADVLAGRYGQRRQAALIRLVSLGCRLPLARALLTRMVVRSRPYIRKDGRPVRLAEYLDSIGQATVA